MKTSNYSLIFLGVLVYMILGVGWALADETPQTTPSEVTFNLTQPDANQLCSLEVVECPNEAKTGKASWLVYQLYDSCASRDFPKGTMLQVSNGEKSITCTVRDFGPDESIFPDRIIDLNRDQFSVLAPPAQGIIQEVRVQVL